MQFLILHVKHTAPQSCLPRAKQFKMLPCLVPMHIFGVEGFLFSLGEMAVSISSAPVSLVVRGKTCASNLQHAFSENPSEPRACSKGPVT